ncbi:MAG TPA: DUF5615 family PIN-like protein [Thermoanaerobaculia bacterium]
MRFLLDADLSPRLVPLFANGGHDAMHVYDAAMGTAPDSAIAALAQQTRRCIVTGDFDFADVRHYPPRRYDGIVVLTLPYNAGPAYIERLVWEFLNRLSELSPLEGKLLIVEPGRIRVRT